MSADDSELQRRAAAGEAQARQTLLEKHLAGLRAYVRLRLGDALRRLESSGDIVQEVCVDVLAEPHTFEQRGDAAFRCWLYLRAEAKIIDRARYWGREKRARERQVPLEPPQGSELEAQVLDGCRSLFTPSRHATAREELARLEAAFLDLPPAQREAILLSRIVGLSAEEIATRQGRSREAVWQLISRGLARLSSLLDEG